MRHWVLQILTEFCCFTITMLKSWHPSSHHKNTLNKYYKKNTLNAPNNFNIADINNDESSNVLYLQNISFEDKGMDDLDISLSGPPELILLNTTRQKK